MRELQFAKKKKKHFINKNKLIIAFPGITITVLVSSLNFWIAPIWMVLVKQTNIEFY